MEIIYYRQFSKNLKARIKPDPNLFDRFKKRIKLFSKDSTNPILEDHQLTREKKDYRAFSITSDIRIVYYQSKNYIYFIDVGIHNQVY